MIQWMVWAYIDTDFLNVLRYKFQIFMGKNVLKGLNLFECNIYNTDLRNSLMNMIGNLLHTPLMIFDMKLIPPLFIKIDQ